jgi:2-octaprenyl-6-methoxyphenol hydroxylase
MSDYEIGVIGAGPAGSLAALALARAGRKVAFVAPPANRDDRRTTALMDQSIAFIDRLGIWQDLKAQSAGLKHMRIIDGTDRLLRAPVVSFRAGDIDLEAFGYNFPNSALNAILETAIAAEPNIERLTAKAQTIDITDVAVTVTLDDGSAFVADFVVGADGRNSLVRTSAGIGTRTWSYPQSAIVLNFAHDRTHENISTEFHTETGPFTQVPLPGGKRSSLVWVVKPAQADDLMALPLDALSGKVEDRMQSLLGRVSVEDGVQAWPLSGLMADRFGKGRIALVGEASHVFPPIGAQGLNLSLRDVIALTDVLAPSGNKPIAADAGTRFDWKRRADIMSRTASVDLLNRTLLSGFLPVQMLRAAGLHVLDTVSPLRHLVMREGVQPGGGIFSLPKALREKFGR